MRRFVDNTYLLSVGSCLRGEVRNRNQISTFLRFVGEIVGAEAMYYTGDTEGPVYPATKQSVDEICSIFADNQWLRFAELNEENFISATYGAADHLIEEMQQFDLASVLIDDDLRPPLPQVNALDEELHQYLINPQYSKMTSRYGLPKTSNFAGFVLSRESVREALDRRLHGVGLSFNTTVVLGIAVRMLAYDEFARVLGATYLPSTSRAERWILPTAIENKLLTTRDKSGDLSGIVDALIRVGKGKPREILREAWLLRTGTSKIRSAFSRLERRGDAAILKANNLAQEYRTVIEQLLGRRSRPRLVNALFKTVSLTFGLSGTGISMTPSINEVPLREWWAYKRRSGHVHALAVLEAKAARSTNEAYRRLFVSSTRNVASGSAKLLS